MPGVIDPVVLWDEPGNPVFDVFAGFEYFFRIAEVPGTYPPEGAFSFEISSEAP
jgi:hypothetical protein